MSSNDKKEIFELVTLKSGHKSLRLANTRQTFHPGIGPLAEADILYVQQQKLIERCSKPGKFIIWDVGLGAAANALAAIRALENCEAEVELHSFEKSLDPLDFAVEHAEDLEYPLPYLPLIKSLLENKSIQVHPKLNWILHQGDFREVMLDQGIPSPNAIFYDPYSLTVNTEMWTLDFFKALRERLSETTPCLLSNYTRSTALRVTLLLAGFYVGVGATIGNKEESTVASNKLDLIENPLDERWLSRVKASQNASPIRGLAQTNCPISEEDYQLVINQKQFQRPTP
jgi:tRNA U34 5-methylaminomethyl-2-thiouridine-forming methyltransferase MnmC